MALPPTFFIMSIFKFLFLVAADVVEAGVFAQYLGDYDAVGLLIVFEDGCNDAGQCKSRTVEGVAETGLLVAVLAETELEPVGLEGFKVGN